MSDTTARTRTGSRWAGKLAGVLAMAASCALAYWAGSGSKANAPPGGGLVIADKYLNLGDVWETERLEWPVVVENHNNEDVEIVEFSSSCMCVQVAPPTIRIGCHQQATARLVFDLAVRRREEDGLRAFPVEITIKPRDRKGLLKNAEWKFRGQVKKLIEFSPQQVYFDLLKGTAFEPEEINIVLRHAVQKLWATCDSPFVETTTKQISDKHFTVAIQPKGDIPLGRFEFVTRIQAKVSEERQPATFTVAVQGKVQHTIQLTPDTLLLGSLPVGVTATEAVLVQSIGGEGFEITKIETPARDTTVDPLPLHQSFSRAFRVGQRIAETGNHTREIAFIIRYDGNKQLRLPVQIHYKGLEKSP